MIKFSYWLEAFWKPFGLVCCRHSFFQVGLQELGNGWFQSHYVAVHTHAKRSSFLMGNKKILVSVGSWNANRKMTFGLNLMSTRPASTEWATMRNLHPDFGMQLKPINWVQQTDMVNCLNIFFQVYRSYPIQLCLHGYCLYRCTWWCLCSLYGWQTKASLLAAFDCCVQGWDWVHCTCARNHGMYKLVFSQAIQTLSL